MPKVIKGNADEAAAGIRISEIAVSEPRAVATGSFVIFIYHWPFGGFICHRTMSNNEQMKNAKWKITNDPVATARGSDTVIGLAN